MAAVLPSPTLFRAKGLYRRIYGGFGIAHKGAGFRKRFLPCLVSAWDEARGAAGAPAPLTALAQVERRIALLPYRANPREAESVRRHR
jgi:hypothetical protein